MPIIDHKGMPETPWRPNYHKWDITRPGDGTTSSSLSYSEVGIGAGAPLHAHESDELIVVLEGTLEARIGDEVSTVGAEHTIVVPPDVPHAFKSVGPGPARILGFFPMKDPFAHTRYLEGTPPDAH
jgi:quercetin dioxygenase-like cupin family protein